MEQFTDDSSGVLGLDHRASYHSRDLEAERERKRAEREAYLKRLADRQRREREEYLREIAVKNETDLLRVVPANISAPEWGVVYAAFRERGYVHADAADLADAVMAGEAVGTADDVKIVLSKGDPVLGASVEDLMKPPITPDKHSSRSRSKKRSGNAPDALQAAILAVYGRTA